jgi:hypothetical protein
MPFRRIVFSALDPECNVVIVDIYEYARNHPQGEKKETDVLLIENDCVEILDKSVLMLWDQSMDPFFGSLDNSFFLMKVNGDLYGTEIYALNREHDKMEQFRGKNVTKHLVAASVVPALGDVSERTLYLTNFYLVTHRWTRLQFYIPKKFLTDDSSTTCDSKVSKERFPMMIPKLSLRKLRYRSQTIRIQHETLTVFYSNILYQRFC